MSLRSLRKRSVDAISQKLFDQQSADCYGSDNIKDEEILEMEPMTTNKIDLTLSDIDSPPEDNEDIEQHFCQEPVQQKISVQLSGAKQQLYNHVAYS